ncbi:MAG: transcriptional regulator [Deltaproteobacteria bacterium CG11_big_fil_rev_8_21_14_0_20_45_16]|nr:MAG: transcriptional regulator [Deltaproteobacteria bacterium CG11_big_fil_rev_8_21_14_0_20_45_16]
MNRAQRIESLLRAQINISNLVILDESSGHSRGKETHYKVTIVSDDFKGVRQVARQQKVYSILKDEFDSGMHSLSLHLFIPEEWESLPRVPDSPTCRSHAGD